MPMDSPFLPLDFERLFAALPAHFLILKPDSPTFTILTASDGYLEATGTRLVDIVGRGVFEAFPENTSDTTDDGASQLRASLNRVQNEGVTHRLPMLRYDIVRPDGRIEEKHWTPINSPVRDADGHVVYIVTGSRTPPSSSATRASARRSASATRPWRRASRPCRPS